jgi:hypothetical protein
MGLERELAMTNQTATSLYERLGGYDGLAVAVDDLLPRLQGDPQLGVYWRGQNDHKKKRGRQMRSTSWCRR